MAMLNVSLLGDFKLTLDGALITRFRSDKVRALLAYLIIESRRSHTRGSLAGLFWPEQPDELALRNLSQTLVRLREAIGDDPANAPFLLVTRQTVQWNNASTYQLDVAAFTTLARSSSMADLEQAAVLYHGEPLPGFNLPGCVAFEEWLLLTREQLAHQAMHLLDRLAQGFLETGHYDKAEAAARRQIAFDPWCEGAYRQVMQALYNKGQRAAALAQYEQCRSVLFEGLGVEPDAITTALYKGMREGRRETGDKRQGDREEGSRGDEMQTTPPLPLSSHHSRASHQDWGDAPDLGPLYGREAELERLTTWIIDDRCRLVMLVGMGGLGKTSLALHLAQSVADSFDMVIWRSVLNAPPFELLLREWLQLLTSDQQIDLPPTEHGRLNLLLDQLGKRRCLFVLDNLEAILLDGTPTESTSAFREGYADYGQLLQRIGQGRHQSCLLLTSREAPQEVARLVGPQNPVRLHLLPGLDVQAARTLFQRHGLTVRHGESAQLVDQYSGNPLALTLVARTIDDLFGSDVTAFLAERAVIFDDIRAVLDQQWARLSPLERQLLTWIAIEREPVSLQVLQNNLVVPPPRGGVLEAMRSLQRRALMELRSGGFALQNVVTEYVTDRIVTQVSHELLTGGFEYLARHALVKASAPEYVRQSQIRLILDPVARWLLAHYGRDGTALRCRQLLRDLQEQEARVPGYTAANLIHLLHHAEIDLEGYDLSRLSIWQADLRGVSLHRVNFGYADFRESLFTDAFKSTSTVAWSPAGDILAGGTLDGMIHLWRTSDWQPLGVFRGHTGSVGRVVFGANGKYLASASDDSTVRIWDVATGRAIHILQGHKDRIQSVACSADGSVLASGGDDTTVIVWDGQTGAIRFILRDNTHFVECVAISANGAILATGCWDQTVRVWNLATGELLYTLRGHSNVVRSVDFNADGTLLVSGSWDSTVLVWDLATQQVCQTFRGHSLAIASVAFSPDGSVVASVDDSAEIRLWDAQSGHQLRALEGHTSWVRSVAFHPDGAVLASGGWDQTVRIWSAHTGYPLHILRGYTNRIISGAWSPNGMTVASSGERGIIHVWDVHTEKVTAVLRDEMQEVICVAWNPTGSLLASGCNHRIIRIWDVYRRQIIATLEGHTDRVNAVAWHPAGSLIASGGNDQMVRLWDVHSKRCVAILQGHTNFLQAIAFSPDGRLLASGGNDSTIRLWDVATGTLLHTLTGHNNVVMGVIFSPDGEWLASGSWDQTARLWHLPSGQTVHILEGHTASIEAIASTSDWTHLATCGIDQTIRIWRTDGTLLHVLQGHTDNVRWVAFSPDGTMLLSGSHDETMRVWKVETGKPIHTLQAEQPYAGMNIAGTTGLHEAQKAALVALGALENGCRSSVVG